MSFNELDPVILRHAEFMRGLGKVVPSPEGLARMTADTNRLDLQLVSDLKVIRRGLVDLYGTIDATGTTLPSRRVVAADWTQRYLMRIVDGRLRTLINPMLARLIR